MFSFAYFRDGVETKDRPILFCFNGGPGSSSMYVHAGFFSTKRLKYEEVDRSTSLPPYEVIDNPDCLLDVADIVCIDPVGTGYGILFDESKRKDFFGIEEDAEALLMFVERWLHKYNRWTSPKYLIGESYGCTRAAVAAGLSVNGCKEREYGMRFDGIVMIGNTVTVGKYFGKGVPAEPSVLNFPTFAAINHYHNKVSDQSVEEFAMEAKAFADSEYLLALYKGEALEEAKKEEIIKKITYYTNMDREYLIRNALKIEEDTFRQEVIKDQNMAVSRYDGRVKRPFYSPMVEEVKDGIEVDATANRYDGFYYGALTGHIFPMLNIKLDRPYVPCCPLWKDWNRESETITTAKRLRNAMKDTMGMRIFFANGWYDDCTEIGHVFYTIDHAGLPKDRVFVKGYASGHMIYLGEENSKELSKDIRNFIKCI